VSFTRGQLIRRRVGGVLFVVAGIVSSCGRGGSHDDQEVASLYLTCAPASRGVHCQLLALFRDVRRAPRDVTPKASWRVSGIVGAQISEDGMIDAPANGDLRINAQYASHHVQAQVRLARDRPGLMLTTVRGKVYAERDGTLRPVAHARVEVVGGPSAGLSTTTLEDGSYEFQGVVPVDIVVRATKSGYTAVEGSAYLHLGDNHLNLLIEIVPQERYLLLLLRVNRDVESAFSCARDCPPALDQDSEGHGLSYADADVRTGGRHGDEHALVARLVIVDESGHEHGLRCVVLIDVSATHLAFG
jgi:hypothetical protein